MDKPLPENLWEKYFTLWEKVRLERITFMQDWQLAGSLD